MNLFDISQSSQEELFDTLVQMSNTRIEFWYDQDDDE